MKRFEKFTHRLIKSLIKHLKKYRSDHKLERLHQIRVDIKKIKAILQVINETNNGFKAHKNFIPFRKIFRKADNIREPDVLLKLLLHYQVHGINDDRIFGNRKRSAKAFESDVPRFISVVKKRAKKLEAFSDKIHSQDFTQYLREKKQEVKSQLYPRPKMSLIHKVRKAIKEVIYLSEVQDKLKGKEAVFYDEVQGTIGQLHDKQVLLGLLKNKKNKAYSNHREAIKSECLSNKKQIFRLAHDYYGF